MVIFKRECPILKELNEALKTMQGYFITDKEKEKCTAHFLALKICCGYGCSRSLVSQLVTTRLLNSCGVINTLPYVAYDPKDNHRIFGIYEDNGKIRVEVG